MQPTLAFAPTPEDLDEGYFDAPILTSRPNPPKAGGQSGPDKDRDI